MTYSEILSVLTAKKIINNGVFVPRYASMISKNVKLTNIIINATNFLNDASINERMYCIKNNITRLVICINDECNNKINFKHSKYRSIFCSRKCSNSASKKINTTKKTNLAKYGYSYPFESKHIQIKIKKGNMIKHGYEYPFQSEATRNTIKDDNIKKHGYEYPFQSDTMRDIAKKRRIEIYGTPNVLELDCYKQQSKDKRYDYMFSMNDKLEHNIKLLENKEWLVDQHIIKEKPLYKIAEEMKISDSTVGRYLHKHSIDTKSFGSSFAENEIKNIVIGLGFSIIENSRKIIAPYEIDIFIPQRNIAIEYNGIYWHSEQMGKDKHYHKNKYNLCKNKNIQLITIFEDEWRNHRKQVISKIKHLLDANHCKKIFARKTLSKSINTENKKIFLDENHIQGNSASSINIGLFYNNDIVACMTFMKLKTSPILVYELKRFATSETVVGGFSKLLAFFKKNHKWDEIISFADLRWSNGDLYTKTGWEVYKILKPDYSYSPDSSNRYHKFNYRKKQLPFKLLNYNPSLSERENCDNNNILRVWDCGKIKFIMRNKD